MNRIFIIGGPGNISTSTINDLLAGGQTLAVYTLPQSPVKSFIGTVPFYFGNRNDSDNLSKAIMDFKPEIVIDYCCFTPEQAYQTAKILAGKLRQLVFISTCDVYGYPLLKLPMTEDAAFNEPNCKYAADKRICEEVLQSYGSEELPLTIVRPSYSLGKAFAITAFSRAGGRYLVPRLRAGKPVFVPGDGTTLMHPSVAENTGRMIARLTGNDSSISESYTCGHDSFMSHDDYIRIFARVLEVEPNIVHIPTDLLYSLDRQEIAGSLLNDLTRHNVAFSMEKFKSLCPDFIWEKSIEDGIRDYIDHNDRNVGFPSAEEEIFEDRLIMAWLQCAQGLKSLLQ